jgi:hypothetical protein
VQHEDEIDEEAECPWARVDAVDAKALMDTEGYIFVDVR